MLFYGLNMNWLPPSVTCCLQSAFAFTFTCLSFRPFVLYRFVMHWSELMFIIVKKCETMNWNRKWNWMKKSPYAISGCVIKIKLQIYDQPKKYKNIIKRNQWQAGRRTDVRSGSTTQYITITQPEELLASRRE